MSPDVVRQLVQRGLRGVRQALRGKLSLQSSATRVQLAQVAGLAGETFQNAEVLQQSGFRSVPLKGSQVVVVPLSGNSAQGVIISCANGQLFVANMQEGETAVFNEREGHFIHLKNGGIIHMEAPIIELVATTKVSITSPTVQASGDVSDGKGTMAQMRTTYNSHNGHVTGGIAPQPLM